MKLLKLLNTLVLGFALVSCGGGSGSGNPGTQGTDKSWAIITANISPGIDEISGESNAPPLAAIGRDVDIFQNPDCPSTVVAEGAQPIPERFTDHDAILTLLLTASNNDVPVQNHIVEGYRIDYSTETLGAPPIQSFTSGSQTIILSQDETVTAQVVLLDLGRKLKLASDLSSGQYRPQYAYPTYTAIYTIYGRDIYGNPFETVVQTNFEVGNFDYCPKG